MFLGLDLGTSGVKGVLVTERQHVIGTATAPLTVERPKDGWSEQDPGSWIVACEKVIAQLRGYHAEFALVRGIGLSGHMHGATVLGGDDRPLRPCILWNDTRSHAEAAAMDALPGVREASGNIVFPGFTAPKLLWMERHEPALFDKVAKVLLPKDYLRLWLTGEHVSEMSDAAGTAWLDVGARDWSDLLLKAGHMDADQMPSLVEGSAASGKLRAELARSWGLGDVVVAGGAGDNAASAVGMGVVRPGEAFASLGTSGVLFVANDAYRPNPASAVHAFCHALPGSWHQMGVILAATDALNWYARLVGAKPSDLTQELGEALQAPGPAQFLPYLGGERTPHNDAAARGVLTGLSHADDRAALTRAVVEGVCYAFRDSLEALKAAGTKVEHVWAVGGGSASHYWLKALATALDVRVDIPKDGEFGAGFGAARLALMAATGAGSEACPPPAKAGEIEPDEGLRGAFEDGYGSYTRTYRALREARA